MSYLALFCFLVLSRARVHFCCAPLILWLALIVCDVALVLCASSLVQKSLSGWHRSCCFSHCMSLDRSLRTRRINLIKPSLGHIKTILNFLGARITAVNSSQIDLDKPWHCRWYCFEHAPSTPAPLWKVKGGNAPIMRPLSGVPAATAGWINDIKYIYG